MIFIVYKKKGKKLKDCVMAATNKETSASSLFEDIPTNHEKQFRVNPNAIYFTSFDYGLFCLMLLLSAAIGIYFGFFAKKKQDNTMEYLLGGKNMKFFPIAASLIASHINGKNNVD